MAEPINVAKLDKFNERESVIPITFSISDFRDPSSRKGAFSKTIKLPGTKVNDSVFANYFDPANEGFLDPNKRIPAFLDSAGDRVLEGSLILRRAEVADNRVVSYDIQLIGDNAEWFDNIKDKSLRDLTFGTITFDEQTIRGSWGFNGNTSEYVFPLIDYGRLKNISLSDIINNNQGTFVEDYRPALFVKRIINKILEEAGFSLKSDFFEQQEFRDLILPFTSGTLEGSEEFASANEATRKGVNPVDVEFGDNEIFFPLVIKDDNNNTTQTTYTAQFPGNYTINFDVNGGVGQTPTNRTFRAKIKVNGDTVVTSDDQQVPAIIGGNFFFNLSFTGELLADDVVTFHLELDNAIGSSGSLILVRNFDVLINTVELVRGIDINLQDALPDITQQDFLKGLLNMFNLYLTTDNRSKTVTIEPRDQFFQTINDSEDWTNKLDTSVTSRFEPIIEGLAKKIRFRYKPDSNDIVATNYFNDLGIRLGDGDEVLENDLLSGEKDLVSLPFSATAMGYEFLGVFYMPVMIKEFNDENSFEFEPRILIYEGLKDAPTYNEVTQQGEQQVSFFRFEGAIEDQYPFAYHEKATSTVDDIDLNFRSLTKTFGTGTNVYRGLIEIFYRRQINQINKGRFATRYFKLNDGDIANLSLRSPKLVDGIYYYINKIEDYKVGDTESTKVELLQKIN